MINFNLNTRGGMRSLLVFTDEAEQPEIVRRAMSLKGFTGKVGELLYFPSLEDDSTLLIGLGDSAELTLDDYRYAFFKVAKQMMSASEDTIEIHMPSKPKLCHRKSLMAVYEGFRQAQYRFSKKSDAPDPVDLTVNYTPAGGTEAKWRHGLAQIKDQMDGVFLARDLVNETSNIIYPESLALRAKEALEAEGVEVTIYGEQEILNFGMAAYHSVAMGSDKPPRLIVMSYNGDPTTTYRTGLIGKGLTYDSGGYCIKPPAGMVDMHCDMGGAGTVIGTMLAIAKSKLAVNVVGVVAACENLISGHAFKTGDIIGSMSGKTIEVRNTDAEGRLTLADAMYFTTDRLAVDRVIDLATLTGAAVVALGEAYTAAITNDEGFLNELVEAAKLSGEKLWMMPTDPAYMEMVTSSEVADLNNSPGRNGGTITAGLFVGEFLAKPMPWIHLDIAGTAYPEKARRYLPARATGVHVKTLYTLLDPDTN